MIINTAIKQVILLVIITLFLRIFNFSFPTFTADEARIAFRGYELSQNRVDELGRRLPFVFNAAEDYQLPVVSYISALGAGLFGKSELAARFPFIAIGLILVLLTYKVASRISSDKSFPLVSALIVATSPVLIFISKIPNEPAVATVLFLFLFYLLIREKLNLVAILLTMIVLIFTTKFSWFILLPFVVYTVFVYKNLLSFTNKLKLSLVSLFLVILSFSFFLQIPQGIRSLTENNWPLFSNISVINGINRIRGQGLESGWPPILERILISKLHFFQIGTLHWLSNIQPAILFGQFSKDGNFGFISMGAFTKITIIPTIIGLIFLIRIKKSKLLLYPLIMTLPATLIYPKLSPQLVILTLPFIAFVIAFGLLKVKKIFGGLIVGFMIIELLINFFFLSYQTNITAEFRPDWIKPIVKNIFDESNTGQVLVSDDITKDPASFIEWYTTYNFQTTSSNLWFPYKISQTDLRNIKLIGSNDSFKKCEKEEKTKLFLTKRDLDRGRKIDSGDVVRTYLDNKNSVVVSMIEGSVCLK